MNFFASTKRHQCCDLANLTNWKSGIYRLGNISTIVRFISIFLTPRIPILPKKLSNGFSWNYEWLGKHTYFYVTYPIAFASPQLSFGEHHSVSSCDVSFPLPKWNE